MTDNVGMVKELWQDWRLRLFIGLVLGLAVIVYFNPPHTGCSAQKDFYLQGLKNLNGVFRRNLARCASYPDPGGCYPVFETLRKMEMKLHSVSQSCVGELSGERQTETWLREGMEIYVKVAWGGKSPASSLYKNGWLEISQIADYCKLKKNYSSIFGEESWLTFVESMLTQLPDAPRMSRTEVWNRSILSDPCRYSY